jgi:hemolysin D
LWSVLGKIDIIVDAQGRIVPSRRTQTITAMEVGVVAKLHVTEGQTVRAGDRLIDLDTRSSDHERDKAIGDRQSAQLQAARSRALLTSLDSGYPPALAALSGVPVPLQVDARRQLDDQWRDFVAKRDRLAQDIVRYSDALPLATERAKDYEALAKEHDVSQHAWSEKEQARVDLEGQLRDARADQDSLVADTRKTAQESLYEAQHLLDDAAQDAARAQVHSDLLTLQSPVDGTVQQLAVHTVGAAVPLAQPLMEIVPKDGPVEIDAMVSNKDIGFVHEGQPAEVKIEAFEYTKYGTVPAHIVQISRDAAPRANMTCYTYP